MLIVKNKQFRDNKRNESKIKHSAEIDFEEKKPLLQILDYVFLERDFFKISTYQRNTNAYPVKG